ncbi:MAG: ATP-grasp domain-containing protein [Gemmatimonadota bacterium]
MKTTPPEALLLGSGVTVLGALRCLAGVGISARVVSEEPFPYRRSRWYRPAPPFVVGGLPEYLHSLSADVAVLIPCSDRWVGEVAGLPQELKDRFPSSVPPLAAINRLLDKGLFSQLLEDEGVPHPRTFVVDGASDVGQFDRLDRFFVKPRNSQLFQQHFGVKAFFPDSAEGLAEKLELARRADLEVMLQEYVPGPASNHYFVDGFMDAEGQIRAIFARRRLRMHPPHFGNSSYMVSIPVAQAQQAVDNLTRLLRAARYRGIFSAEFKKDQRDEVFKILEINARPWWFVEFAANCGVNVVEMAHRDALGHPVDEVREYRVGKYFIHPYYDISACLRESPSRARGLITFLRSLPGADRPVLRWDDPLPALSEFSALTRGFVRRRLRGASSP